MTPTAVEDAWAVQSLVQRYGIAVDTRRFAMFDTIFVADAYLEYFGRRWADRATFRRDFEKAHSLFDMTQHAMSNHVSTLSSSRGTALTYCHWRLERGSIAYWGTAWYDDVVARTDEGWRIAERRCELLWSAGDPAVAGADRAPAPVPLHVRFA